MEGCGHCARVLRAAEPREPRAEGPHSPFCSQGDRGFDGQSGHKGDQGEKGERVSRGQGHGEPRALCSLEVAPSLGALFTDPDLFLPRVPPESGASQVPGATMVLLVPLGRLAVLVPKDPKDFRARR